MREIKLEVMFYIYNQSMAKVIKKHYTTVDRLCKSNEFFKQDLEIICKRQFTGLKDKNGVDIYDGDLLNIFYTDRSDMFFFDGIYRVNITPSGVKFDFVKLLWEFDCYNQNPYEKAEVSEYGFIRGDYKNTNVDFRLCVAESNKWNYSNYFEVIGNIHENPELLD